MNAPVNVLVNAPMKPDADSAADRIGRLMANDPTLGDLEWLAFSLRAWVRFDGAVPLLRCLGLPSTPTAVRLARRDEALRAAVALCAGPSLRQQAHQLRVRLLVFAERGAWRLWRRVGGAPENATAAERLLFDALDLSQGKVLSARQIERVLRARATPIPVEMSAHSIDHGGAGSEAGETEGDRPMTTTASEGWVDLDALDEQISREWARPETRAEFGNDRERYAAFRRAEAHGLTRVFEGGPGKTASAARPQLDAAAGWNDPTVRAEFGGNRAAWDAYCAAMSAGRVRVVAAPAVTPRAPATQMLSQSAAGADDEIQDPPLAPPADQTRAIDRVPGRMVIAGTSIPYSVDWQPWRKRVALDEWARHKAQANGQGVNR